MTSGLYGCVDDSIWKITRISFIPTVFGHFRVFVNIKNPATNELRRLKFKTNDPQEVFDRFKPLSYFQDKYPEYFL